MIRTISPQDMREMERGFLDGTGFPSLLLMEHAALAVVRELEALVSPGTLVLFVCGGGNNGGDGCAAARLWMQRGGRAEVWLLRSPSQMTGDAGLNAALLNGRGAVMKVLYGEAPKIPAGCRAVVDALYGTGLSRAPEGAALSAIRRMNESALPIVAVDLPAGVDGATGHIPGEAVRACVTVAFHRAKHGHLLFPGRAYTGKLIIADIGILQEWDGALGVDALEEADARALLPTRERDANKGSFGHVLCVAGSEGMAGAACLCTSAALRSGAGLATLACPFPVLSAAQTLVPCAMARAVSMGPHLGVDAAEPLAELAAGKAALALGPGLGRAEESWLAILDLVESDTPKVVDADGLFLLAEHGGLCGENTVLTPHPGEMSRLLHISVAEVTENPVEAARKLSQETDACVLLKGATTVIAQGEDLSMNLTGCDGMATGGCGDVLTGLIAGLMAQGLPAYDAARLGAYWHGKAGEAAQADKGARAMTAWDLEEHLKLE